jgi:hypothetical protein
VKKVHAVCELTGDGYGYGLDVFPDGFGHGGDMLGYVARMRAGTEAGIGVVAFVNGLGGAWAMVEGALAIARGEEPPDPNPGVDRPLVDDGSGPPEWSPYRGRYRAHNPWLPTFLVAARDGRWRWAPTGSRAASNSPWRRSESTRSASAQPSGRPSGSCSTRS